MWKNTFIINLSIIIALIMLWAIWSFFPSEDRAVHLSSTEEQAEHVVPSNPNENLSSAESQVTFYVKVDVLNVRGGPSTNSPIVGKMYLGETVLLYEQHGKWGRISNHYDTNDGERWVSTQYVSTQVVIPTQSKRNQRLIKALSASDDYENYELIFIRLSQELIDSKQCKIEHFE